MNKSLIHTFLHQSSFFKNFPQTKTLPCTKTEVLLLCSQYQVPPLEVVWESDEVLQIPVNTGKATQKGTLSTFSLFLFTSFDAEGILGKGWRLIVVSSTVLLFLHFLPTHLICFSSAHIQRVGSQDCLWQVFVQCLAQQQLPVPAVNDSRSCSLPHRNLARVLLSLCRVGDPGWGPSCAAAPSTKLHKGKNLGLNWMWQVSATLQSRGQLTSPVRVC